MLRSCHGDRHGSQLAGGAIVVLKVATTMLGHHLEHFHGHCVLDLIVIVVPIVTGGIATTATAIMVSINVTADVAISLVTVTAIALVIRIKCPKGCWQARLPCNISVHQGYIG